PRTELLSGRERRVAGLAPLSVAPGAPSTSAPRIHRSAPAGGRGRRRAVRPDREVVFTRCARRAADRALGAFAGRVAGRQRLQRLADPRPRQERILGVMQLMKYGGGKTSAGS